MKDPRSASRRLDLDLDRPPSARRGPPNRMNDLAYRDWMKFQKSFFRHSSYANVAAECIQFFTKAVWPDGRRSESLAIGFDLDDALNDSTRDVRILPAASATEAIRHLEGTKPQSCDFVIVNLLAAIRSRHELSQFLANDADRLFAGLQRALGHSRYCCLLVDTEGPQGGGFPMPWAVAVVGRRQMKLRDEKIGLRSSHEPTYYCLFFQNEPDSRPGDTLDPDSIRLTSEGSPISSWLIPKSPPRTADERFHPAKFPEPLVEEFIGRFTQVGDAVLDPMVGTGSSIRAACKLGRTGVGVDLSPEFVEIARRRLRKADQLSLFSAAADEAPATIVQGDATNLLEIAEVANRTFAYCITSPPYWSMLGNPGSENQRARRERNLPLVYSTEIADMGNVADYDEFVNLLCDVYRQVANRLARGGYLTVVVKNVKRNHVIYPLAWDLVNRLCSPGGPFTYAGTTLWCQDDIGLKPFAVGIYWVSNVLHQYCLHLRKP